MNYSSSSVLLFVKTVVLWCWVVTYLTPLITGDNKTLPSHPPQVIAPHCSDRCGNVSIPYPFGIEEGCFYEEPHNSKIPPFKIRCDHTTNPPKPIFGANLEVLEISLLEGEYRTKYNVAYNCYNQSRGSTDIYWNNQVIDMNLITFTLSSTKNILVAIGCDTLAWFKGHRNGNNYSSGCMTTCVHQSDVSDDGGCSGIGCCQVPFPTSSQYINVTAKSFENHTWVNDFNPCSVAFAVAKDAFKFNRQDLGKGLDYYETKEQPVVINWTIGNKTCSEAKADGTCLCKDNTECYMPKHGSGYRCNCRLGYSGNPYLPHGCTDIDECKGVNDCENAEYCINTNGGYYCQCPKGYHGNGTTIGRCIQYHRSLVLVLAIAGTCTLLGSIILLFIGWWLYSFLKRREITKQQRRNFEKNGGMLLKQQMSSDETIVERIKFFTINELKKATDNFNEERKLGQGGQGSVYKGMLGEGRIVAVKKSNELAESQCEEFINEVVIMSQISHRSILKLLGCCLETEVPLLVYEFIPNGTLFHHIHNPSEDFPITWKMRLQIGTDIAGALAYLHSSTSTLIFHRDIKSSNILLDDKYRAKLSDFGTSRSVDIDQTHVVTRVMGTFGYMDPEYFQSHQFTEKSDVYSFGVVLVELLTGQKAVRAATVEDRSLTSWFLFHMENSCVLEIVDSQLLQNGSKEEFLKIADLAHRCLHLDGKKRPTMKEVLLEIEAVLSFHMPQTFHSNDTPKFEQATDGTTTTTTTTTITQSSSTFSLESRALDSAELSLLFNSR